MSSLKDVSKRAALWFAAHPAQLLLHRLAESCVRMYAAWNKPCGPVGCCNEGEGLVQRAGKKPFECTDVESLC